MGSDPLPAEYAASINFASEAGSPPFAPMCPVPIHTDLDLCGENARETSAFEGNPNDESFMDLVASLMEEEDTGQEDDTFDLVNALARDIATHGHHLTPGHPLNMTPHTNTSDE